MSSYINASHTSAGFALLALLALLLFGAAGTLAWTTAGIGLRGDIALDASRRLERARDSLVAYSVSYPDLYGPSGAGPGHLPCPDTDPANDDVPGARLLSRAGPNPPCGTGDLASGLLPAHVTVAAFRHGVDRDADVAVALGYRVSTRVINNPLNRLVNGRSNGARMATIFDRAGGSIPIRFPDVLPAAERRVAAWIIERAGRPGPDVCGGAAHPSNVTGDAIRSLVDDGHGPDDDCSHDESVTIEGVPQVRHWFVRNGWAADFDLSFDAACTTETLVACHWSIDDTARRAARSYGRIRSRSESSPLRTPASRSASRSIERSGSRGEASNGTRAWPLLVLELRPLAP